ncbi:hypothetical protein PVAP13_1KG062500 [Panicum virgatum]|uniref:CBS domain-containing protein n=1 Tax=Panicum virgatum TaxID=38727 RepID=A0A8T0XE27_PANVG|nr:hypothetical protein PVAP13_1KG062500 [Panicum virgatum]
MAQLRAPADDQRQQEALHGDKGGVDVAGGGGGNESNKKASAGLCGVLRERKVVDLARAKRRLVEVPYTATLAHTANALLAARVSAVAVAAPPGHWIGAGGSMILESDPATGAVRKHYIGMVNMLDILAHIAEAGDEAVFAVASGARVIDAVKAMRAASLTAVPVVDAAAVGEETLQDGVGKKAVETFSATDLRDCPVARLQPWLGISVTEFKRKVAEYRASNKPVVHGADATGTGVPVAADADAPAAAAVATDEEQSDEHPLVTCSLESTLCEAIEAAVTRHVHRLWAVDGDGLLRGVMSLTDVLRAVREAALGEDRELHSIVPS